MTREQMQFIVPAAMVIIFFFTFFGTLAWVRWVRYLEMVALAERGILPPEDLPGAASLRWGMVLTAVGVVMSIAMYPVSARAFRTAPLGISPVMLAGLLPLAIGVALVWHYRVFAGRERHPARLTTDVDVESD